MSGWLKTLTAGMCILTILMHLIPQGKFAKYVKFYAGLLFFLLALQPVMQLFGQDGELERLLQLEFLKEEYYDMETAVDGMAELKNNEIRNRYQQEILRQIKKIASAYSLNATDVTADFDGEDGYFLKGVSIVLEDYEEKALAVEEVRRELAEVYGLSMERIRIEG